MQGTAENRGGRDAEIICEDRLSNLPDDLLKRILVFVPTKYVVSTMVLSKRWCFLWTTVPVLVFSENGYDDDIDSRKSDEDDDDDDDDDDDSKKSDNDEDDDDCANDGDKDESERSVWWFLDKSLELHKAAVLTMLCIKLGKQCPTDADVGKWVAHAVDRGVRVLSFKLGWSVDPIELPKSLYACETLVELTLSRKILVDFPPSSCLPSLKNLDLFYVVYKDEDSLLRLLSSCPVLEILFVKRNPDDNVGKFCVKVPSLWLLTYDNYTSLPDDGGSGRCLIIGTPALKNLYITDYSRESCFIDNMPCLEVAGIDVWSFPDTCYKFLRSLSGVRSLELVLTDEMALCCSTIKFSRLIKCKINPCDSDWMDSLVALLGNMPELKFLIVDYRLTHEPPDASMSWRETSSDPECLSTNLEKFELIDYRGREEEEELVEYILGNSTCLKTATISLVTSLKPEDKDMMMEKLKDVHSVSIGSQLLFKT